jgi:hypothetical protein
MALFQPFVFSCIESKSDIYKVIHSLKATDQHLYALKYWKLTEATKQNIQQTKI